MGDPFLGLSAREREVMDVLYRLRQATAAEVSRDLTDPPSNATVRSLLRVLEEKGHIKHHRDGLRYVYEAMESRHQVKRSALRHIVKTFFDGSSSEVVAALVERRGANLSKKERARIRDVLAQFDAEEGP